VEESLTKKGEKFSRGARGGGGKMNLPSLLTQENFRKLKTGREKERGGRPKLEKRKK